MLDELKEELVASGTEPEPEADKEPEPEIEKEPEPVADAEFEREEAPTEPEPEPEQSRARKRLTSKQIFFTAAATIVAAGFLFAVIWRLAYDGNVLPYNDHESLRPQRGDDPPVAHSDIQDALDSLDWVSQEFLPINEYSRPGALLDDVNGIVIHYIGNPSTTAMQNRNYFANLSVTQQTYASSNFIVDLDGAVIQCVPVNEIAYASNTRNSDTLSIELCHPDETGEFTEDTYLSAVLLTAWLCARYNLTTDNVIRHYDVTGKICPKYFVENENAWERFKFDVSIAIESERVLQAGESKKEDAFSDALFFDGLWGEAPS